jgi:hypothetical protein
VCVCKPVCLLRGVVCRGPCERSLSEAVDGRTTAQNPTTMAARSRPWVLCSWLLVSWVRIPLKEWMFVFIFLCCVLSVHLKVKDVRIRTSKNLENRKKQNRKVKRKEELGCRSHCGVTGSRLAHSMWDLWWTEWHWDRFFSEFFGFSLSISFHRGSPNVYSNWEMNNRPAGSHSSQT